MVGAQLAHSGLTLAKEHKLKVLAALLATGALGEGVHHMGQPDPSMDMGGPGMPPPGMDPRMVTPLPPTGGGMPPQQQGPVGPNGKPLPLKAQAGACINCGQQMPR